MTDDGHASRNEVELDAWKKFISRQGCLSFAFQTMQLCYRYMISNALIDLRLFSINLIIAIKTATTWTIN